MFACAITGALRRLDDDTYVRTFRAINTVILNGWFLSVFLGAPLSALGVVAVGIWGSGVGSLTLVVAGAVCSALTFVITAAGNVPLNQALDAAPIDTPERRQTARLAFETRWNYWNIARTITSTGAVACLAAAAVIG